ncbi:MAG: GIY-YIG nuclease family protein [Phycisphaerae bacterium]|nr:GIY-YIG nuclease family protein [Phycisphaerae bacterium]
MTTADPLVGGYLEHISVKAFEKYHGEITSLVQTRHGVYALYSDDRLYYVGLAVNLRRRIEQHLRGQHAGRWNRFSLYLVRRIDHTKEIESLLLRIADPTGNKQRGRLSKATNLELRLRQVVERRQRAELEEIFSRAARLKRLTAKVARRKSSGRRKSAASRRGGRPLKGIVARNKRIYATYKGEEYKAVILHTGRIKLDGRLYDYPSAAAQAVTKKPTSGWGFWRVRKNGELIRLSELRSAVAASRACG